MRHKVAKIAGSKAVRLGGIPVAYAVYQRLRRYWADTVDRLVEGCVVCHSMIGEQFEHSGIYIGEYKIVSLSSKGKIINSHAQIVEESTRKFIEGPLNSNRLIWVSCRGESPVGDQKVAARARKIVGERRNYNVLRDNCHQFTSGCLTGDFENADKRFTSLKSTVADTLGADNWRIWARDDEIQRMCEKVIQKIAQTRSQLERLIKSDFEERERLIGQSFNQLRTNYGIEDIDGFLKALAEIAPDDLPWKDFEQFDDWMCDDETVLDLTPKKQQSKRL